MTLPTLPPRGPGCPPAIDLEREASGEDVPAVRAHLPTCEPCRGYVEKLRAESAAFQKARPPERFLSQLEARPRAARGPRTLFLVAAATAALLVLVLFPKTRDPAPVLFKGSLSSITVKRGDSVTVLQAGDTLAEGDALRFSVKTERPGFALVLNRDGRGKVAVVAPFNATAAQAIPEGTTVLDDSAVLDATKGRETFVTVFAPRAFESAPLLKLLEARQPVTCEGCVVEEASFEKP